jgi:ADP-ribose pyrophosphatase
MADSLKNSSEMQVEVLERGTDYKGHLRIDRLSLRHSLFGGGWSEPFTRELMVRGDAVAVLLYDPDRDTLVMIEQFRVGAHAAGVPGWMMEVVAGLVDKGRGRDEVARAECREEAGCEVEDLFPVLDFLPSPGACDERLYLYCGRVDSRKAQGIHGLDEEHEDIRVEVVPAATALQWVDDNRIANAATLVALLWFARNRESLRRRWPGNAGSAP